MPKNNNLLFESLPMGFSMALAQNIPAMNYFGALTPVEQQNIIDRTKNIASKNEMRSFVDSMTNMNF